MSDMDVTKGAHSAEVDSLRRRVVELETEVARYKRIDDEWHELSSRWRAVYQESPVAIVFSRDGITLGANPAYLKLFGYEREEEIIGSSLLNQVAPSARPIIQQRIEARKRGEQVLTRYETVGLRKDGSEFPFRTSVARIQTAEGPITTVFVEDITERNQAEASLQVAQARTTTILEGIADTFYSLDKNWKFTQVNPAAEKALFDRPAEELIGHIIWDLYPRLLGTPSHKHYLDAAEYQRLQHYEAQSPLNERWYEVFMQGWSGGVDVYMRDITERKQAEATLRASEERHRIILRTAMDGFWLVDLEGRLLQVNETYCRMIGYSEDELLKMNVADLEATESPVDIAVHTKKSVEQGRDRFETRHRCKSGVELDIEVSVQYHPMDGGRTVAFLRDITERKQAEAALLSWEKQVQEALQRLDLALKSAHLGVWDWDVQRNEMVWDGEMMRMYGLTRESFPGGVEAWQLGLHPEDRERVLADCQAALDGLRSFDTEFRIVHPDGEVRYVKADGLVFRDDSGKALRMLGLNRDITSRRKAEAALRESEAIFSTFLEHSPIHVFFKDANAHVLRLSRSFETMFGIPVEQAVGMPMEELFPLDFAKSMVMDDIRILREGKRMSVVEELGGRVYETTKFPIFVDGKAEMIAGFTLDITERKQAEAERAKLQEQLAQAQKMESVGRLAGGVAHDFNNMLGVMLGNIELASDLVERESPVALSLREIRKAAERSSELTKQLLAFARKQTISPKLLDVNVTVEGMLEMFRRLVGENIEIIWTPGNSIGTIHMDPTQLHQILANLCVNARDAITDVGHIQIETSRMQIDQDYCAGHIEVDPGDYVMLMVRDDGSGMDRATLDKLFEPFFTTKELGRGTGLGLSTVHGIVKQNGGHILVRSEPGHGTTFKILLPVFSRSTTGPTASVEEAIDQRGRETILLVEDEPSVLAMGQRMLESLGYSVIVAGIPGQALRLAREYPGTIHLLISDVVMPEMNGRDLAKNLLSLFPKIQCLFISGYTADVIAHKGVIEKGVRFIQKPFTRNDLARMVRYVIDNPPILPSS